MMAAGLEIYNAVRSSRASKALPSLLSLDNLSSFYAALPSSWLFKPIDDTLEKETIAKLGRKVSHLTLHPLFLHLYDSYYELCLRSTIAHKGLILFAV